MPEYRRAFVPGGTFFFTLVAFDRRPLFADPANVARLRAAAQTVQSEHPFDFLAGVVLLDHTHFIWTLPPSDSDYPSRIGRMKALFTRDLQESAGGAVLSHIASRAKHRERDVWQRRFWEHTIRDDRDLEHHLNYLHFNPVKHGLCGCPHAWVASSFHKWVERNAYASDWCCACHGQKVVRPYPEELDAQMGE